jgi:hypothetical protein
MIHASRFTISRKRATRWGDPKRRNANAPWLHGLGEWLFQARVLALKLKLKLNTVALSSFYWYGFISYQFGLWLLFLFLLAANLAARNLRQCGVGRHLGNLGRWAAWPAAIGLLISLAGYGELVMRTAADPLL